MTVVVRRNVEDLAARVAVGPCAGLVGRTGDDDRGRLARGGDDRRVAGRVEIGVAHHADWVVAAGDAAGEPRIVGDDRAHAHHDRGEPAAVLVHAAARGLAGDPARQARCGGDSAVERHRVFEHDERCARGDVVQEDLVERVAFLAQYALRDLDARVDEPAHAFAGDQRVRVGGADHHASDSRVDECLRARRLLARVAAGFQRDVDRGAAHVDAVAFRRFERGSFGVPSAEMVVMSGGDDRAVAHDDRPHHRIRVDLARSESCVAQCHGHETPIVHEIPFPCDRACPGLHGGGVGVYRLYRFSGIGPRIMLRGPETRAPRIPFEIQGARNGAHDTHRRCAHATACNRIPSHARADGPRRRSFFHPDYDCRYRNLTGSASRLLVAIGHGARGLNRRSGISPCPEDAY